ncbi:MAG: single-stranded DNA-binding protein [Bacilli bacterium]|nr:single-stranded DNA-binding protein [Bacilli bacterium]
MNKVILIGRLTKDPELRTIASGNATTSFTIAVNRNFTNQNGEREADFINCVAWRKQAENVAKYCTKGSQVAVEGRIQTRSYDAQDGTKRYVTEVVADNVTFLGSRASGSQISESSSNTSSYTANSAVSNNTGMVNNDIVTSDLDMDPYAAMGNEVSLSDDDLPF